jgi:hypothetical protein
LNSDGNALVDGGAGLGGLAPSFKTPGHFALMTANLVCPATGGGSRTPDLSVFLKDGRVAMFGIQPRRGG